MGASYLNNLIYHNSECFLDCIITKWKLVWSGKKWLVGGSFLLHQILQISYFQKKKKEVVEVDNHIWINFITFRSP